MKIDRTITDSSGMSRADSRVVEIEIRPGFKSGTKITFERYGDERPGHIPADITFIIREKPHPLYTRDGNNLHTKQAITLTQALCGFDINLPFLAGQTKRVRSQRIIRPGDCICLPGEGMPLSKEPGKRGDLTVAFDIRFPTQLSQEEKMQIQAVLGGK